MNIDNIFDAFDANDREIFKGEDNVEELLDNMFIQVGTFIKGVQNYFLLDAMYARKMGNEYASRRDNLRIKYYTVLIKELPNPGELQVDTLNELKEEFGKKEMIEAFEEALSIFVEIEEYDHCINIKEFIDIISGKKSCISP